MPRQNWVLPTSEVVTSPGRFGTMFGNRGVLHDRNGDIVRHADGRRWIACVLEFKGRRRHPLLQPGRYTELFFLDEVTALAAGHRPCHECRRADFDRFAAAWEAAVGPLGRARAAAIDHVLHVDRGRRSASPAASLPDGTMVDAGDGPGLVWQGHLLPWSSNGYGEPVALPAVDAAVLTPRPIVATLAAGYTPARHTV